jgi:hypothetical protein
LQVAKKLHRVTWPLVWWMIESVCVVEVISTYIKLDRFKLFRECSTYEKRINHFNRIVPKRSVFLCFLSTRVELMTSTQKKMLYTICYDWSRKLALQAMF